MKIIILLTTFLMLFQVHAGQNSGAKKHKLNENVPAELMINFRSWIRSNKVGTVIDLAGGKLYRIEEGARFVDSMGITVVVPIERPDYNYIALKSPALAKYWLEKYNFKPRPLEYERDTITDVDDNIVFFDSLKSSSAKLRAEEKEVRKKISGHPAILKDFSCVSFTPESPAQTEVRTLCDQLIKLGLDHKNLFDKMKKTKNDLDAKGKNDLEIPEDARLFDKDFSPFVFKTN